MLENYEINTMAKIRLLRIKLNEILLVCQQFPDGNRTY